MSEKVDTKTRVELFMIALTFHDIGKFQRNIFDEKGRPDYEGHEELSEDILQSEPLKRLFTTYGLSEREITMTARLTRLHYAL